MILELSGRVNKQVEGSNKQTGEGTPLSPCRFCGGNHWNDSCIIYHTARDRKRLLKYRCYICLKSGHRAFECKAGKVCYFCGRRNHHHRSLCETKFGSLENGSAQLGSMIYNYPQGNLNYSHDKEGVSKENKSKRTETDAEKTSCKLKIMDSEDEVYVPQTSMEIKYALTINKTQEELKKCMNENLKLKQTISVLEKEKETMQRNFSR